MKYGGNYIGTDEIVLRNIPETLKKFTVRIPENVRKDINSAVLGLPTGHILVDNIKQKLQHIPIQKKFAF